MKRLLGSATTLTAILAVLVFCPLVLAQPFDYAFIADKNTPIPSGTGNFEFLPLPGISNGDVIFNGAGSGGQEGIYFFRGGVLDVLLNQDTLIPNGTGTFTNFNSPTFDPNFNVTFRGEGNSGQIGVYVYSNGTLSALADLTTDVPGTSGAEQFTNFSFPWIYDGDVVFRGLGSGGRDGIYTNAGGSLRLVADTNTNIPNGTGQFTGFGSINTLTGRPNSSPSIDGGDVAFLGNGSGSQEGIYAEVNGSLIRVADKTMIVPGSAFLFPGFSDNRSLAANIRGGDIVFVSDDVGLFKYSQGTLSTVVDINTVNPQTGGTLQSFGGTQGYGFHDGDVSFLGDDTGGPQSIYAVLDGQVSTILSTGDVIEGRVVGGSGTYGQGIENGSVAANIGGPSGANYVAIQEHRWLGTGSIIYQGTGSGDHWDDRANWPFGLLPREVVPTVIDPAGNVTVHGPHSDVTLASLQVGGGNGIATLWLHGGSTLTVPTANIESTGLLAGDGTINGNIDNNGLIRPDNVFANRIQNNAVIDLPTVDSRLEGSIDITNDGMITGDGTLIATFLTNNGLVDVRRIIIDGLSYIENYAEIRLSRSNSLIEGAFEITNEGLIRGSGTIDVNFFVNTGTGEVRIANGERLTFNVDSWTNEGLLEVRGGEFESDILVTNNGSGLIAGRDATFRFGPGLNNNAAFAISFGTSDVFGDVSNNASGTIVATGNSNTTFYDDVTNNGTFQVSSGSTVVLLGDFNGANGISGTGTVFLEGDLRPGNSPAEVSFGGDLYLGALASLEVELGGSTAGTEYDRITVADVVSLAGTLDVTLINGFTPAAGDTFEIITAASVLNTFSVEDLPNIGALTWGVDYNFDSVVLSVLTPFTADFDGDGDVDGDDLTDPVEGWQARYGSDLDGRNFIDWQRQFGSGVPTLVASTNVPEPSSAALLSYLAAAGFFRRRVRQVIVYAQLG